MGRFDRCSARAAARPAHDGERGVLAGWRRGAEAGDEGRPFLAVARANGRRLRFEAVFFQRVDETGVKGQDLAARLESVPEVISRYHVRKAAPPTILMRRMVLEQALELAAGGGRTDAAKPATVSNIKKVRPQPASGTQEVPLPS